MSCFLTSMCWLDLSQRLQGSPLQIFRVLCATFSSWVLWLANSNRQAFLSLSSASSSQRDPSVGPGNPPGCELDNGAHLHFGCFLSLGNHSSVLLMSSVWNSFFSYSFVCLLVVISCRRVNLAPVVPSALQQLPIQAAHFTSFSILMISAFYYALCLLFLGGLFFLFFF